MTVSPNRIQRHLAELNIWLPLLDAQARPSLRAPHYEPTRYAGTKGLPFNLEKTLDNTDDGPGGVRTSHGLLEILQSWANQFAKERNETHPLHPIPYLHTLTPWATQHPDWEAYADTITSLRDHVAQLIGYADQQIGTCPRCNGRIMSTPDRDGLPEWGTCTTCDYWYADQNAITLERDRLITQQLKTSNDPTLYVPLTTIKQLYPTLQRKTLNQWVQRGHVKHAQHGYQLAPINSRMGTVP